MLNFLSRSFFFISIFSLIRLYIGILVASYIFPLDYATVLVPLLVFGFLDIYIEGGFIASIIKNGITKKNERDVIKEQLRNFIKISPFFLLLILIYDIYHIDKVIPLLVIFNYWILSFIKIWGYSKEGLLIFEGRYILLESLKFLISLLTYSLVFYLIFNSNLEGFYILCLWASVFSLIYVSVLGYMSSKFSYSSKINVSTLSSFAKTNRNVSLLFNINNRIDELTASNILGMTSIGLFAKFKEISISFGELTNKVITKPWFYVACNNPRNTVMKLYSTSLVIIFLLFIVTFPISSKIILVIIDMLGENWKSLTDYGNYMIYFLFFYFLSEYSKSTLLACGGEDFAFKLEKIFFILRVLIYSFLIIASYMGLFRINLLTFVIIEVSLRVIFFLFENLKIYLHLVPKLDKVP